jgi:hypothetical protein
LPVRSAQEAELVGREIPDIRKDRGQTGRRDTEPLREGRTVLIYGRGRDQYSSRVGVAATARREQRKIPVELAALYPGADDEMMITPGVVAAIGPAGRELNCCKSGVWVSSCEACVSKPSSRQKKICRVSPS